MMKMKMKQPYGGKETKAEERAEAKMPMAKGYANGGLVRQGTGAPNECTYNQGPGVRSMQDYGKGK